MRVLDRLPSASPGPGARALWIVAFGAVAVGVAGWALGSVVTGVIGLWAFMVAAVALAFVLPLPYALVSPLFMGLAGWLVDMLPLVILVGWGAVVLRWAAGLARDRRMPRGGWWIAVPLFLAVWTALGILVIGRADVRHFALLVGIQGVISGVLLVVVDRLGDIEERTRLLSGLSLFVVVLSAAVGLQWVGVPVESLQTIEPRQRVEAAYGLNVFPNAIGMIKYARSINAGAGELREDLRELAAGRSDVPEFSVFRPKFQAFDNSLVVRFEGSAREVEHELSPLDVRLLYDNVGLAPANSVPRLRSFPRNALTYAGVCAVLFPATFYLAWTGTGRRRMLGWAAAGSCLFGAGFSLARGSWIAILIGVAYLGLDSRIDVRRKMQVAATLAVGALVVTGTFLFRYGVDPVTGRAGGGASVNTRSELYGETLAFLKGKHLALGYGTTRPRTEHGAVREGTRYVPRAGTHSTYLNYLFRTGVPGALAVMVLYAVAWAHARAAGRLARDRRDRLLGALLSASVVTAAAHAVILSLYVEPTYTLTVSLALGLAVAGAMGLPGSVRPWSAGRREATA